MQLPKELIALGAHPTDKTAAIKEAAKLLSDNGKVAEAYLEGMLARESQENTYLGNGVAIPHGTPETSHLIQETAISVLQIPAGVAWGENGEQVYLVVAIAANGDQHLQILRRLTRLLNDSNKMACLKKTTDPADIQKLLLMEEKLSTPSPAATEQMGAEITVILPNPLGLHARPATRLMKLARQLSSPVFLRTETGERADTKQLMALLALGLTQGSRLVVESEDPQAAEEVANAILSGLGDDLTEQPAAKEQSPKQSHAGKSVIKPVQQPINAAAAVTKIPLWTPEEEMQTLKGLSASEGLAFGTICHYEQHQYKIGSNSREPIHEAESLDWALKEAARGIFITIENISQRLSPEKAAIFNAHLAILNDEMIINDTITRIADGENAASAYKTVIDNRIAVFAAQPSAVFAARSADLQEVRDRVLKILLGIEEKPQNFPPNTILCANDLTPGDIAHLPAGQVFGIITSTGTPNDHNAIIARGMDLPMIVGVKEEDFAQLQDGNSVIIDADMGKIFLNPTSKQYESVRRQKEKISTWRQQAIISRMQPGHTQDGKKIDIFANINHAAVASAALDTGAEGVGLMRTESIFMQAHDFPKENEQVEHYMAMAKILADRPLIIRTVDLGGKSKPAYLDFSALDDEIIPSRGLRLSLANQDWFIPQLRAICRTAQECGNVKVIFPMVSTLEDFLAGKALLEKIRKEIDCPPIPIGALIETPAAALITHHIAQHADFLSIGTNDLSRYTLVTEEVQDALHPAVLQLIDWVIQAAKRANKRVGICGAMAGDVTAAKIFVGLGVDSLSLRPPQIATIKQALREANSSALAAKAQQALSLRDAQAVRALFTN